MPEAMLLFRIDCLYLFISLLTPFSGLQAAPPSTLRATRLYGDFWLSPGQQHQYWVKLKRGIYARIRVTQKGVDLVLTLSDSQGHRLQQVDSPTGKTGVEELTYLPDSTAWYSLTIQALATLDSSQPGSYTIQLANLPRRLTRFRVRQLVADLSVLQTAYRETQVGYWYNTTMQMDSAFSQQRRMLTHRRTALDFYRQLAPLVAFTKEGHSWLRPSDELNRYNQQRGQYVPLLTDWVDGRLVVRNDWQGIRTRAHVLTRIDGYSIDSLMHTFLPIEPSDGYNQTSKHHWIAASFSLYYQRFFPQRVTHCVELRDPQTGQQTTVRLPSIPYRAHQDLQQLGRQAAPPASLVIDSVQKTAVLTFRTFRFASYEEPGGFQALVDEYFRQVRTQGITHLIIDVRHNEGGSQGAEDYVLSYLVEQPYLKYSSVSLPAFSYSFYAYTDRREVASQASFEARNRQRYHRAVDGRILANDSTYRAHPPQATRFTGRVSILIGGLTFSGGSEFAALAKNHTQAVLIGEETGGGYYGNTSGQYLQLTLPNTQLKIRLPLVKFMVHTRDQTVPYGRGVLPDYPIQPTLQDYSTAYDRVLEFAKTRR